MNALKLDARLVAALLLALVLIAASIVLGGPDALHGEAPGRVPDAAQMHETTKGDSPSGVVAPGD